MKNPKVTNTHHHRYIREVSEMNIMTSESSDCFQFQSKITHANIFYVQMKPFREETVLFQLTIINEAHKVRLCHEHTLPEAVCGMRLIFVCRVVIGSGRA